MKAIRLHARGGAEQLIYEEAPRPVLQPGDALVRVLACSTTRNELDDLVTGLGADQFIDYKSQRFDEMVSEVDMVLDTVGGETQDRSWKVLRTGGTLVSIAGESIKEPDPQLGVKGIFFIVKPHRMQLIGLGKLIDQEIIKPLIANVLPLEQAQEAFRQVSGHGVKGKVVLRVSH